MKKFLLSIILLIAGLYNANAQEPLYAVGGFNGWDPLNPAVFNYEDGLYTLEIDFSKNLEFKISTVKGTTGNGWSEFDQGTLAIDGKIVLDRWLRIYKKTVAPNIKAPQASKIKVIVDLGNMYMNFGGGGEKPTAWSGTLPVLFINTENSAPIVDKEKYLNATWWLDPMGVEGVEAIGSKEVPLSTQIKGRGNYSWSGFEKKPYRLKLADKQPLMGMPSSKHFVLLAHADDNDGFLRNESGFALSEMLGMPWTPKSEPVELVLNGGYRGLYFLTENIRVAKDRVNIIEQEDLATQDVDGGWLVEIDNYDTDPHITVPENGNASSPIWFTYKSPEELSAEQETYLQTAMQQIDNAVYCADNQGDNTVLSQLVDFDILARFYITQEIVSNCESFHGSCYLNRNRGEGNKWLFGPVWDFGNAFGHNANFIWQNSPFHQVWIGQIYQFPAFQAKVKEIWAWYLCFGPERIKKELEEFVDKIYVAAQFDAKRWPEYGNADIREKLDAVLYSINYKTEWLKQQWGAEAGIEPIEAADTASALPTNVYNLQGIKVLGNASNSQINALPAGMYITPGGKIIKK
ncbi:MAG: CotH kinase family protein [Prevotella sp.]|nr:CotH kinase family protein [Prevotella sp.]MCM1075031.1 CotH kinase family protein [Ruminococcus sp.]